MQTQSEWTGSATELLLRLRQLNPLLAWPETPKGLTQLLRRTALDNIDFQSQQNPNGTRSLLLKKITKTANRSADAQQPVPVGQAFLPANALPNQTHSTKPSPTRKQAVSSHPRRSHSP